jgi:hypothetical protein
MGTSKNVRSPDIPPWKPFIAVIGRKDVTVERQAQELWRAAHAERGERLVSEFSQSSIAAACALASRETNVTSALREFDSSVQRERRTGFAIEVARRALARAVAAKEGATGFAANLFADASAYYASRDLSSYVGAESRVDNTSSSIAVKDHIRQLTKQKVAAAGTPKTDRAGWTDFVSSVLKSLRETK